MPSAHVISCTVFVGFLSVVPVGCAHAQLPQRPGAGEALPYPSKPIRLLVGFTPGGGIDITARKIGQKLAENWGYPVVVDNRAGAGGTIAMKIAADSAADGYTLLGVSGSQLTNASLFTKVPFHISEAFTPITQMTAHPYLLLVHAAAPAKSVKELIALAKSRSQGLNYASAGSGSLPHLGMELFKQMTKTNLVHVPYKGVGPAFTALLGGEVHLLFSTTIAAMPHVKSGKLRVLAVTTAKRAAGFPDFPTIAETGVPGFEMTSWYGLVAPARSPWAVITKLNQEIGRILGTPEIQAWLTSDGAESSPSTPQQFGATIENEIKKWAKVASTAGIQLK